MYSMMHTATAQPACKRGGAAPCTAPLPLATPPARSRCSSQRAVQTHATPQQQNAASLDVSGAVVQPSFRQTPWAAEADTAADTNRAAARVAFISESGLCRSVLAAAAFKTALHSRSPELAAKVVCECRATKDYCLGQGPDPLTVLVAAERGWELPEAYKVQQFYESRDIVEFDVCLVMDKFTAADVLREVSVFDTIKTWGKANYSSKVRRLGEFSALNIAAPPSKDPEAGDIGDALYGNVGGEQELESVRRVAVEVQQACDGFADFIVSVAQQHEEAIQQQQAGDSDAAGAAGDASAEPASTRLGDTLTGVIRTMSAMEWLVPPMLQPR
ncbi:hypothetical protein D9Q98_005381 [Chlorella vulgaris]|uniref:protein-tyrosine-phosphatase n=1 Tax=Chlorella vulgaris TaxID=3077 RepID=A0A9D4TMM0_CHLVU|nr:hypothetical protein D9Q98_005381 [Chlorella vulgaris]